MRMQHLFILAAAVAISTICTSGQNLVAVNTVPGRSISSTTPPAARDVKSVKEKAPSVFSATIADGALTVDGMIAKARLNYDIQASYIYIFVPDVGTVVVAQADFQGAERQKKAFRGSSLIVTANGHVIELSSDRSFAPSRGKDAYVYVDSNFRYPDARYPVVGFGNTRNAPYAWPGSKAEKVVASARNLAPPVPRNLLPKMEVVSAYTVVVKPVSADEVKR